ncbi:MULTISPECIES: hypothetical protein [Pseudomonas]|uniref:Uncharacterized protein n=1 Tax=Pseudomonas fluorescens TaxID=294 RepID=A0A166QR74_PSEFL|nr:MULTISPECIES: hypothetical protein [Pseudomonas]KZN20730.1 hypothetical protein A1D17_04085 [Pseudomonas fluorescens]
MTRTGFFVWIIVTLSTLFSVIAGWIFSGWKLGLVSGLFPVALSGVMYGLVSFSQRKTPQACATPVKVRRKRDCQFRDETEALTFLKSSYSGWTITEEDIKQLAFLHFFGWTIAEDCQSFPLKLIRGCECMIFNPATAPSPECRPPKRRWQLVGRGYV